MPTLTISEARRAEEGWRRISDRPTSITVKRGATLLPAQTVRLEFDNAIAGERETVPGSIARGRAKVFGIRNHPALPDTDLMRGDRFLYDGAEWEITARLILPGELQCLAEVLR